MINSIEVAANDRVKTDSRDSEKIARHLSAGNLRGVHIPTEEQELARVYQRTRQQIRETRTMIGNQIKSKLFQFGWIVPENDELMSLKYLRKIPELLLPQELRDAIETLMNLWKMAHEQILELDKKSKRKIKIIPKFDGSKQCLESVN